MIILFLVAFINMVGFGMIFPLLPLFKLRFLLTDIQVGYIASVFAIFSLFGTLFFGVMSDKFGRKYTMSIPLILAGVVYFLTAYVTNYYSLLILRGITGFLTGSFIITFAMTSDMADDTNKFKYMGIIGSAFSLGFILGPALGGYFAGDSNDVASVHFSTPFLVAGAISLLAGVLSLLFLRESLTKEDRRLEKKVNIAASLKELYTNKNVILFTYLTILFSLVLSGIEVYLSIWLNKNFHFTTRSMGFYWGTFGIIITIIQLVLPRFFTARQALIGGFLLFGLSFVFLFIADNIYILAILTFIMAAGIGIVFPSINVSLSLQGEKNQQGLIFGVNQSFGNLGRIIGPYILGMLYTINPNATWIAIIIICVLTALLVVAMLDKPKPAEDV